MNSKVIHTLTLLFILCSFKCKKLDADVNPGYIHNMSKHTITASLSNNYAIDPLYPDTTLPTQKTTTVGHILPDETKAIFIRNALWKNIYEVKADRDTISFFIYDVDTLNKYPRETIREQYMILKRYDLSFYDLQKLNYTLYYPPTEAMRDMKMWPPFEADR